MSAFLVSELVEQGLDVKVVRDHRRGSMPPAPTPAPVHGDLAREDPHVSRRDNTRSRQLCLAAPSSALPQRDLVACSIHISIRNRQNDNASIAGLVGFTTT